MALDPPDVFPPDAATLRADTRLTWSAWGLGTPTPPDPDPLDEEIAMAVAYVEEVTLRDLADFTDPAEEWIAWRAIKLRVIQQAVTGTQSSLGGTAATGGSTDRGPVTSLTVPGYSVTYADLTRGTAATSGQATSTSSRWLFNPWLELDRLLQLIATEEALGNAATTDPNLPNPPFSVVTEMSWRDLSNLDIAAWDTGVPGVAS